MAKGNKKQAAKGKKDKTKRRVTVKTIHEPHTLPCKLGDKEKAVAAEQLAKVIQQAESLELEKKTINADFKSRTDNIRERIHNLSSQVRESVEMRSVDCRLVFNYNKGTATLTRLDTNEEVETRPMTDEEKQMHFDFENEQKKK